MRQLIPQVFVRVLGAKHRAEMYVEFNVEASREVSAHLCYNYERILVTFLYIRQILLCIAYSQGVHGNGPPDLYYTQLRLV